MNKAFKGIVNPEFLNGYKRQNEEHLDVNGETSKRAKKKTKKEGRSDSLSNGAQATLETPFIEKETDSDRQQRKYQEHVQHLKRVSDEQEKILRMIEQLEEFLKDGHMPADPHIFWRKFSPPSVDDYFYKGEAAVWEKDRLRDLIRFADLLKNPQLEGSVPDQLLESWQRLFQEKLLKGKLEKHDLPNPFWHMIVLDLKEQLEQVIEKEESLVGRPKKMAQFYLKGMIIDFTEDQRLGDLQFEQLDDLVECAKMIRMAYLKGLIPYELRKQWKEYANANPKLHKMVDVFETYHDRVLDGIEHIEKILENSEEINGLSQSSTMRLSPPQSPVYFRLNEHETCEKTRLQDLIKLGKLIRTARRQKRVSRELRDQWRTLFSRDSVREKIQHHGLQNPYVQESLRRSA